MGQVPDLPRSKLYADHPAQMVSDPFAFHDMRFVQCLWAFGESFELPNFGEFNGAATVMERMQVPRSLFGSGYAGLGSDESCG